MNKRNGTAYCRWDRLHPNNGECKRLFDAEVKGAWLCREHATSIAKGVGYMSFDLAKQHGLDAAERELKSKDAEIARLKGIVDFYPEPTSAQRLAVSQGVVRRQDIGVIYFLRVGGFVKIGWTSNLEKRMRQYMPDTQLLAVKPGTRKDERQLHRKFSHIKTHGREWFPLAPQILEEVSRTVADHGKPPAVDFSARSSARDVGARLKQTRSA